MTSSMGINSWVELYDSDILAIEQGPMLYAQQRAGKMLDIDRFTKDLGDQFAEIGLGVEVKVFTTRNMASGENYRSDETFAFEIDIQRRLDGDFDFDRMVSEVTKNILDMPDQDKGFINTSKAMDEFARQERDKGKKPGHVH